MRIFPASCWCRMFVSVCFSHLFRQTCLVPSGGCIALALCLLQQFACAIFCSPLGSRPDLLSVCCMDFGSFRKCRTAPKRPSLAAWMMPPLPWSSQVQLLQTAAPATDRGAPSSVNDLSENLARSGFFCVCLWRKNIEVFVPDYQWVPKAELNVHSQALFKASTHLLLTLGCLRENIERVLEWL